jgi:hypothetical protein
MGSAVLSRRLFAAAAAAAGARARHQGQKWHCTIIVASTLHLLQSNNNFNCCFAVRYTKPAAASCVTPAHHV